MSKKPLRLMWLLNHGSARRFEIPMLKKVGVDEVFLPKHYPADVSFRSASADFSEDAGLSIPAADLAVLNAADWYGGPGKQAWQLANRYFDILFFICHHPAMIGDICRHFQGMVVWRAYGLSHTMSYSGLLHTLLPDSGMAALQRLGRRFFFGEAYAHLADQEPPFIRERRLFLPLGLACSTPRQDWLGRDRRVLFVCPDIAFNPYYQQIYQDFRTLIHGLPYAVLGAQPLAVNDPQVLGFVSDDVYARHMRELRLMFYHAAEPNHIHYHPFEAVRAGMPLLFMAGGMLDRLGGRHLPGRCETLAEARHKMERLLDGDVALVRDIRSSQTVLLSMMTSTHCEPAWQQGFAQLLAQAGVCRAEQAQMPVLPRRRRIAVILPLAYRGGSLSGACLLANALLAGSTAAAGDADIVFCHPEHDDDDAPALAALDPAIRRRQFRWRSLAPDEARRAMHYAGHQGWEPGGGHYLVPDDGMRQLLDCDLWLMVSDRLSAPLLPLRPVMVMVYDYLQRHLPMLPPGADQVWLALARRAERVLVTTAFTADDALQYAGVAPHKLCRLPMLVPLFDDATRQRRRGNYFVWPSNAALHKNHVYALRALQIYYDELDGTLDCHLTGVDSGTMFSLPRPHLTRAAALIAAHACLRRHLHHLGELSGHAYRKALGGACFLWHPASLDNGTFALIEAAQLGVPALCSDYPAMHEMAAQFGLQPAWMDSQSPRQMAESLKQMELQHRECRRRLPSALQLKKRQDLPGLAARYWEVVSACL